MVVCKVMVDTIVDLASPDFCQAVCTVYTVTVESALGSVNI